MKIAFFSTRKYDREFFEKNNSSFNHELTFIEAPLNENTVSLAQNYEAICVFVNDRLNENLIKTLSEGHTKVIALRCAGFNNVDLKAAAEYGIKVVRVPAYSPNAVAEHVIAMLLTLYRHTHKAYNRVKEGNFSLVGMTGHEIFGKTIGLIGTGKIGEITAKIFKGFGCRVLACDPNPAESLTELGVEYVSLEEIYRQSDIISLHCPLNEETKYIINESSLEKMKPSVTIINTSRGGLINTKDVYSALKAGKIAFLGIDVYEEEEKLFFEDLSTEIIMDDLFMRLTTFPNVLITGHQGFFTHRALNNIAETTLQNISDIEKNGQSQNEVSC
ncbi:MAG: 2-hydroxyacid dehydrogenase [Lentisphaeraceae bacterium]|nr:2-hydroxyacid dehydrogenase [Lentisphaeraceae bacterium]